MLQREQRDSEPKIKTKVESSTSLPTETQMMGMLMLSSRESSKQMSSKDHKFYQRFDDKNRVISSNFSRPLWRGEDEPPIKAIPGGRRNSLADNNETKSSNGNSSKYKSHSTKRWICDECGKVYKHPNCLSKHKWEHTDAWKETNKLSISKHQQVQLLEAASVLIGLSNPQSKEFVSDSENVAATEITASSLTNTHFSTSMEYRGSGNIEEDMRSDEDSVGSQPRVFGMEL